MGREDRTYGQWWDAEGPYVRVRLDELQRFGREAYQRVGATADDAEFLFATNLDKALQGDHAAGSERCPASCAARGRGRSTSPRRWTSCAGAARPRWSTVVARHSAGWCAGAGWRSRSKRRASRASRSSAPAASAELLTPFVTMASDAGMVGMALVQSVPTVAPLGGYPSAARQRADRHRRARGRS